MTTPKIQGFENTSYFQLTTAKQPVNELIKNISLTQKLAFSYDHVSYRCYEHKPRPLANRTARLIISPIAFGIEIAGNSVLLVLGVATLVVKAVAEILGFTLFGIIQHPLRSPLSERIARLNDTFQENVKGRIYSIFGSFEELAGGFIGVPFDRLGAYLIEDKKFHQNCYDTFANRNKYFSNIRAKHESVTLFDFKEMEHQEQQKIVSELTAHPGILDPFYASNALINDTFIPENTPQYEKVFNLSDDLLKILSITDLTKNTVSKTVRDASGKKSKVDVPCSANLKYALMEDNDIKTLKLDDLDSPSERTIRIIACRADAISTIEPLQGPPEDLASLTPGQVRKLNKEQITTILEGRTTKHVSLILDFLTDEQINQIDFEKLKIKAESLGRILAGLKTKSIALKLKN